MTGRPIFSLFIVGWGKESQSWKYNQYRSCQFNSERWGSNGWARGDVVSVSWRVNEVGFSPFWDQ